MYIQAVCLIDQLISRLSQELLNMVYNGALGAAPQSDWMLITKEQIPACSKSRELRVLRSVCRIRCFNKLLLTPSESVMQQCHNVSSHLNAWQLKLLLKKDIFHQDWRQRKKKLFCEAFYDGCSIKQTWYWPSEWMTKSLPFSPSS